MGDKKNKWVQLFKHSTDSDSWGQPVEASEGYERLISSISSELSGNQLTDDERNLASKAKVCLNLRIKSMKNPNSDSFSLEMLQPLEAVFKALAESRPVTFPINLTKFKSGIEEDIPTLQLVNSSKGGGTLLPPPPHSLDGVQLNIHIEKIGLKNAAQYLDPFLTIQVIDSNGEILETSQDTPCSNQKTDTYINFSCNVDIQTNIDTLPSGSAILFEFKHWKPKGEYVSTKCWSFMELDEIKPGPAVLEIYQKPTDNKRKKLRLLSVKPLYLHLNLKETVM